MKNLVSTFSEEKIIGERELAKTVPNVAVAIVERDSQPKNKTAPMNRQTVAIFDL